MHSSSKDIANILDQFGVTKKQLDRLEEDASQGVFHGEPREKVVKKKAKELQR